MEVAGALNKVAGRGVTYILSGTGEYRWAWVVGTYVVVVW
jgi:hypothetical protein